VKRLMVVLSLGQFESHLLLLHQDLAKCLFNKDKSLISLTIDTNNSPPPFTYQLTGLYCASTFPCFNYLARVLHEERPYYHQISTPPHAKYISSCCILLICVQSAFSNLTAVHSCECFAGIFFPLICRGPIPMNS
jgi:hypothetical protein